ncbi:MAG: rod shape-determining protein RodA [Deltaproteobacteria bacterium]|nr:rod shape-determining protein RodA [Deltaproteobacteria bacterium]
MIDKKIISQIDWPLLAVTILLSLVGIMAIYSSTLSEGTYFFHRQCYWLLIGTFLLLPLLFIDYSTIERFAYPIFFISLLSLLAVLIFGQKFGGAQRWLSLGIVSVQPSEFAKLAFIIALAKYFSSIRIPHRGLGIKELIIPALILLAPFLLIAKQPDLGTALIFVFIFTSVLMVVKIRTKTVIGIFIALASLMPFAWLYLKDYQKARLLSFIKPGSDPLGSGYHLLQSKIAIGSGGLFGSGFTKGTQGSLKFLPEHHTDFIFPILAEEWGFIGSLIVLGLFFALVTRGLDIAGGAKDKFGFLLTFGITAMIFWHLIINLAMVTGLLPVVGVPLPFLSYGGSFLTTMLIGVGLILNIGMRRFLLG